MTTPFDIAAEQIADLVEPLAHDFDVGELTILGPGRELVPFRFLSASFLMLFSSPFYEAGADLQSLETMIALCESPEAPAENSRIVKFCRADATTEFFDPKAHRLQGANIEDFMDFLAAVMVMHATTVVIEQYLYWPSTPALGRLYRMIFRRLQNEPELHPFPFRLIDRDLGVFCGYERI